ncbi:MAG TPA: sulfatase-like hydrolase/transferase, partial [Burkholderiaceae bacterium]|nr:sulfatase-like hydrolase/transferase [Burkholderiaceae bacterium]
YQEFFGFHSGGLDYFAHTDTRGSADLWENETPVERDGYLTDLLSARAVEFVQCQSADRPFLLSLHYSAPHWPWETRDDRAESERIAGNAKHLDGGSIGIYQRMIHHMDEGIGEVLAALDARGLADDTLVVFTSDNGGERFSNNWPFVGQKMDLLEGGIRVPLVARWPCAIAANGMSATPNLTMDWTATMLAAAGVDAHPDYPLDGVNLLPLFADSSWNPARDLYWRMKHRQQRALIRGDWKYLAMDGNEYLFNLPLDERERANLAKREPQRLEELRAAWMRWNEQMLPVLGDAKVSLVFTPQQIPQATF